MNSNRIDKIADMISIPKPAEPGSIRRSRDGMVNNSIRFGTITRRSIPDNWQSGMMLPKDSTATSFTRSETVKSSFTRRSRHGRLLPVVDSLLEGLEAQQNEERLRKAWLHEELASDNKGSIILYSMLYKQEQSHEDSVWACAWRKNQNNGTDNIVTGSVDDTVKLWRWAGDKMELRYNLEGHQLGIVSVDINYIGTTAASSSLDSHIKLWDLDTGKLFKTLDAGPVDCWTLCFSPDGKSLATGSHTGKINIFGVDSGKKEQTLDTRGKFTMSVAQSPDGKYVVSGAIDGIINIFDTTAGKLLHTLEGHAMPVRSLTFSPDSQLLVTASDDTHIKLYDVNNASLISNMSGHQSWVLSVDFSPDNSHFVTSSSDRTVKVWETSTKSCVHTFYEHTDQVWCAKYNSNGTNIVSVGDDKSACIYECPV